MGHGEYAKSGRKKTFGEFSKRMSIALAGLSLMVRWIDDVRRELQCAEESENLMAERALLLAFVEHSSHFVGYSEAMLREMRDTTEELITLQQEPGETSES